MKKQKLYSWDDNTAIMYGEGRGQRIVCEFFNDYGRAYFGDVDKAEEHAKFLIKAGNNHAQLVNALQDILNTSDLELHSDLARDALVKAGIL